MHILGRRASGGYCALRFGLASSGSIGTTGVGAC